jgi:hypothetical protein
MNQFSLTQPGPILQLAIGSVMLISGVGRLRLTLTNRFGRRLDRSRAIIHEVLKGRSGAGGDRPSAGAGGNPPSARADFAALDHARGGDGAVGGGADFGAVDRGVLAVADRGRS